MYRAFTVIGVSRDTFSRYQELEDDSGINELIEKSRGKSNFRNSVDMATERAVTDFAIDETEQHNLDILDSQDTFYCWQPKRRQPDLSTDGKQSFIEVAFAKLYTNKTIAMLSQPMPSVKVSIKRFLQEFY